MATQTTVQTENVYYSALHGDSLPTPGLTDSAWEKGTASSVSGADVLKGAGWQLDVALEVDVSACAHRARDRLTLPPLCKWSLPIRFKPEHTAYDIRIGNVVFNVPLPIFFTISHFSPRER